MSELELHPDGMEQASALERLAVQADIEALGLKDSRPRRFCLSIDGAGQCNVPCGSVLDDQRFMQLFAQGRVSTAADWQPVLLQRINGPLQLQLPAALLTAASDGALLDLQIGVWPDRDLAITHVALYMKYLHSRQGARTNRTLQTIGQLHTAAIYVIAPLHFCYLITCCRDPTVGFVSMMFNFKCLRDCAVQVRAGIAADLPTDFTLGCAFFLYEQPARALRWAHSLLQR